MKLAGRKVVVTGAGGFIGSHLAERLVGEGARVTALVRYNSRGAAGWLDGSPLRGDLDVRFGDVADAECVRALCRGSDVVFHLAALIGIPYSYEAPGAYVRTNVDGTLNVLNAVRECGIGRMVHTSTSEVYGTARFVPMTEAHPLVGQSPYSATKIAADKLAESFHLSFGVPVVTLRPFNTFGPRQSTRAVIPTIITQALDGPLVKVGSLAPLRDYNFVGNTVDAYLAAATAPGVEGATIHFGSGREISVGDLVPLIAGIVGREVEVQCEDARTRPQNSEVQRLLADHSLAQRLLGWTPRLTLEQGLRQTVDWFRSNRALYGSGARYAT